MLAAVQQHHVAQSVDSKVVRAVQRQVVHSHRSFSLRVLYQVHERSLVIKIFWFYNGCNELEFLYI